MIENFNAINFVIGIIGGIVVFLIIQYEFLSLEKRAKKTDDILRNDLEIKSNKIVYRTEIMVSKKDINKLLKENLKNKKYVKEKKGRIFITMSPSIEIKMRKLNSGGTLLSMEFPKNQPINEVVNRSFILASALDDIRKKKNIM